MEAASGKAELVLREFIYFNKGQSTSDQYAIEFPSGLAVETVHITSFYLHLKRSAQRLSENNAATNLILH